MCQTYTFCLNKESLSKRHEKTLNKIITNHFLENNFHNKLNSVGKYVTVYRLYNHCFGFVLCFSRILVPPYPTPASHMSIPTPVPQKTPVRTPTPRTSPTEQFNLAVGDLLKKIREAQHRSM